MATASRSRHHSGLACLTGDPLGSRPAIIMFSPGLSGFKPVFPEPMPSPGKETKYLTNSRKIRNKRPKLGPHLNYNGPLSMHDKTSWKCHPRLLGLETEIGSVIINVLICIEDIFIYHWHFLTISQKWHNSPGRRLKLLPENSAVFLVALHNSIGQTNRII